MGRGSPRGALAALAVVAAGAAMLVVLAGRSSAQVPGGRLDHLGGTGDELAGWQALDEGRFIEARELGERVLQRDAGSVAGHFILGMALHRGEGDLARAVFHLELAMQAYERRFPMDGDGHGSGNGSGNGDHGAPGDRERPWRWHQATLRELSTVLGAMDRPAEQLRVIEKHNRVYAPAWMAHQIWPLMKLHRYDDARAAAREAMASDVPGARKYARADLCGAESESGDRQRAYEACAGAAREFQDSTPGGGQLEFSNASDAALEVFRFDEAERFILEAMRRPNTVPWVNPFQQAVELFLSEGRIPEAIEALRGGQELRIGRAAWVDQFDRARFDGTKAKLFLLTGIGDRAVAAARRAIEQPDRQGHASGTEAQAEAASSIVLAVALRDRAEREAEDAVTEPLWPSLKLRVRSAWDRLQSWRAMRRAAVALADEELLVRSLRPYYLGILLPPWLLPEVVDCVGGGVALAGLAKARAADAHPAAEHYFRALEAEGQFERGELGVAEALARAAITELPQAEVLLRARMEVILGECARSRGELSAMATHLLPALARDPGLVRRMGLSLPVAIESDGSPLAEQAGRLVARSPRFDDAGGPLRVTLAGGGQPQACLVGPNRERLACASVNLPVGTTAAAGARLLVAELHRSAFAVQSDLSQADLTSLDGSPTAGRADRQVRSVLDKLGE